MIGFLLLGLLIILGGAYLFTNGVEWVGKRLHLSEGIVGSILAGVGTAMPETMVPIIAIFFGDGEARQEVGVGAILGAPFMLSCLTLPLLGIGVLFFAALGKRTVEIPLNARLVRTDLRFFLSGYGIAFLAALLPIMGSGRGLHGAAAAVLIGLYMVYFRTVLKQEGAVGEDPGPLILSRNTEEPLTVMILIQVAVGFGLIIGGAHLFVDGVQQSARAWGVSPLILSLLITPIATELPEKLNSLIWIAQRKDTLAVANITGAMVFQSTFPVAVGLVGTPWQLDRFGLVSAGLALSVTFLLYSAMRFRGRWRPVHLASGLIFYAAYLLYVIYF